MDTPGTSSAVGQSGLGTMNTPGVWSQQDLGLMEEDSQQGSVLLINIHFINIID